MTRQEFTKEMVEHLSYFYGDGSVKFRTKFIGTAGVYDRITVEGKIVVVVGNTNATVIRINKNKSETKIFKDRLDNVKKVYTTVVPSYDISHKHISVNIMLRENSREGKGSRVVSLVRDAFPRELKEENSFDSKKYEERIRAIMFNALFEGKAMSSELNKVLQEVHKAGKYDMAKELLLDV